MRMHKFKAQDAFSDGWRYGTVYYSANSKTIIDDSCGSCRVIPETVSEFTGVQDADGNDIYENDIIIGVSEFFGTSAPVGVIRYDCCRFVIDFGYSKNGKVSEDIEYLGDWNEDIIVTGNIYDHVTKEECT